MPKSVSNKDGDIIDGKAVWDQKTWDYRSFVWTRHFEPGVSIDTNSYKQGTKERKLADIVVGNLNAIVNRDKKAFSEKMESARLAEQFTFYLSGNRFRFYRIESIDPLGDDPNRMNVTVRAERLDVEGSTTETSLTYTLRPDKAKEWRIAAID